MAKAAEPQTPSNTVNTFADQPPTASWLRVEGAAIGVLALIAYGMMDVSWWFLITLILAPDLSIVGYLAGPRIGAICYNLAHTYSIPIVLIGLGLMVSGPILIAGGIVWIAHIGLDRMLGYGLKLPEGFKHTDLGLL